jgi:hypothetical protein
MPEAGISVSNNWENNSFRLQTFAFFAFLFDCSQKASIGLMQMDLKFRFRIRIGLVDEIAPLAPPRPESGFQLQR